MPKKSDYVQIYMTPEGPKIIESSIKSEILSLLEKGELHFDEILAEIDKSKPTLSNHLKILEEKGIIGSKSDPYDKRKKLFYIKSIQLVELSSNVLLDIDANDYFKSFMSQIVDPTGFYALLFRTIRIFLINEGIDINPLLFNIGIFMGESIYEQVKSSKTEILVKNIVNLWKRFKLGRMELINEDPTKIRIYDHFECKDMPNMGRSNSAVAKGILESIFSRHLQPEVLVDETKCYAKGDEYCCFNIKKVERKISPPAKGTIEFI